VSRVQCAATFDGGFPLIIVTIIMTITITITIAVTARRAAFGTARATAAAITLTFAGGIVDLTDDPEIMLGMLQEVLRRDAITGGRGIPGERQILLMNLKRIAPDTNVRPIAIKGLMTQWHILSTAGIAGGIITATPAARAPVVIVIVIIIIVVVVRSLSHVASKASLVRNQRAGKARYPRFPPVGSRPRRAPILEPQ
jgi:hypothetical protein